MRVKLTAKHPRPASAVRAPVRRGTRKPTPGSGAAAAERPAPGEKHVPSVSIKAPTPRPAAKPASKGPRGASKAVARPHGPRPSTPPGERKPYESRGDRPPRPEGRDGARPAYAGNRPSNDRGERPPRPEGRDGARPAYAGNRPSNDRGERPPRPESRDGARPAYAGNRPSNDRGERPPRPEGRDGARPAYAGNRPSNDRGDRPPRPEGRDGARPAYAGNRPSNDRGDRPPRPEGRDGARPAYAGNRPSNDRGERPPRPEGRDSNRRHSGEERSARPTAAAPARPAERAPSRSQTDRDETGMTRLSKRMSELGLCSRREADEWIEQGWVRVDGVKVDTLGAKVTPEQKVEVMPAARAEQAKLVTILIHKPVGYVSGQPEDDYLPAASLINATNQWELDESGRSYHPLNLRALAPAGRLDIDSTGLLVMTQDGRIAKQLIGDKSEVDKEYLVRVMYQGRETDIADHFPAEQLALLCHGLELDEAPLRPAQVEWQNGEQLRFVLREGKKRQIRRMCELVGLEVVGLKRVRIGQIVLGALPAGQWRYLLPGESF